VPAPIRDGTAIYAAFLHSTSKTAVSVGKSSESIDNYSYSLGGTTVKVSGTDIPSMAWDLIRPYVKNRIVST
jgi:hypothetical protein